ncbi:MAG: PGPGW domain-containing protein [Thermoleophilaceae bacterium]|jgi:uncharacterized protein (TIGR02611 family)
MVDPERPAIVDRLLSRREQHRRRSRIYRGAWVVLGFVVIAAGILIAPLPGPGPLIIVPLGLAMLALEFVWAERLLTRALIYAERARAGASDLSRPAQIMVAALIVGAFTTYVVLAILYEIPYLPG